MRLTQDAEKDKRDKPSSKEPNLDRQLLLLLEHMAARVFTDAEQLKAGARDPLGPGKAGGMDPAGGGCDCVSIKNYPPITSGHPSQMNGASKARKGPSVPLASVSVLGGIRDQFTQDEVDADL
jgi:hypothetical protein